jgi:enoyl-CoA hydratase/carnithine racemase
MTDPHAILYETPAARVARIVLNRPATRNAQNTRMLYELNDAFDVAAQDDEIRVIVLAANGPHFSSGHDLRETDLRAAILEHRTVGTPGAASPARGPRRRRPGRRRSTSASASGGGTSPSRRSQRFRGR